MQDLLPYYLLVFVCMGIMFKHALKKDKRLINYLMVIFCASLCMVGTQKLSASSLGIYQYFIGLATCATCNVVWLIARTLFRETNPIRRRHVALAAIVAGLIVFNQTWHLLIAIDIQHLLTTETMLRIKQGMNEITTLLSSSILALSFWEALRNYSRKNKSERQQSIVFAGAFFLAVFNSSVLPKFLFTPAEIDQYFPWLMTSSALLIVVAIQYVIFLQNKEKNASNDINYAQDEPNIGLMEIAASNTSKNNIPHSKKHKDDDSIDMQVVDGINILINKNQIYLKPNLKIADFAQALKAPEYKVSKAIRLHFKVTNFNLFVNQYRIKHAREILVNEHSQHWSILVVALESGFSSLVTFNRVFKSLTGYMPTEYRKQSDTSNQEQLPQCGLG